MMEVDKDFASFWDVKSLFDYLYFCCPACDSKCHIKQEFVDHALSEHPASKAYFKKISDGSTDDVSFLEDYDFYDDSVGDEFNQVDDEENDVEAVEKAALETKVSSVKLIPVTKAPIKDPVKDPNDCTVCDFKAENIAKLKLHVDLTHFKCPAYPKCQEVFALKSKLDIHIKQYHSNERNIHLKRPNNKSKVSRKLIKDKPTIVKKAPKPKSKLTPQEQLDELMKKYGSVSKDGKVTITTTKEGYQELQNDLKRIRALIEKEKVEEAARTEQIEIKDEPIAIDDDSNTPEDDIADMDHSTIEDLIEPKIDRGECSEDIEEEKPLAEIKQKVKRRRKRKSEKKVPKKKAPSKPSIPQLCTLCGEKFPSEKRLKHHEWFKHGLEDSSLSQKLESIQIQCQNCLENFGNPVDLSNHILSCESDLNRNKLSCRRCELYWANNHVLVLHMKIDHGILNAAACELCGKCLVSKTALSEHIKMVHDKIINYSCDKCAAGFLYEHGLKQHIHAVHEKDSHSYLCSFCGKRYPSKSAKDEHENAAHTKAIKYHCDRCDDYFAYTKSGLRKHKKQVHERENAKKSFCPHCDYKTLNSTRLNSHINSKHTKETKILCDYCDFICYRKDNLNQHLAAKHFNQKFSCPYCDSSIKSKQNLMKHFKLRHSEIPPENIPLISASFQCNQCESMFNTKAEVRNHISEVHKPAQQNLML